MPTAKKTKSAPAAKSKKAAPAKASKKKAAPAPSLDWSSTIKKAAEDKRSHANWPGSGDAWKKKVR